MSRTIKFAVAAMGLVLASLGSVGTGVTASQGHTISADGGHWCC